MKLDLIKCPNCQKTVEYDSECSNCGQELMPLDPIDDEEEWNLIYEE